MKNKLQTSTGENLPRREAAPVPKDWNGFAHPLFQFLFFMIVFWIPFYRWRHLSTHYQFMKVDWLLAVALVGLIVPSILVWHRWPRRLKSNLNMIFAMFLVVNLTSSLLSPYQSEALSGLAGKLLSGYAFIAITFLVVGRKGYAQTLPVVACISISICALLSVLGYYLQLDVLTLGVTTGIGEFSKRGVGGSMGANNAAMMYLFCFPFLVHWIIHSKSQAWKLTCVVQIVILLLGLVSTFSRGGFLMLVILCGMIMFEIRHHFHPRMLGPAMALLCAAFILGAVAVPDSFVRRIQSLAKGTGADLSMSRRAAYWGVGWEVFTTHPLLGTGTDTFKYNWFHSETSKYYKGEMRYAHNTYIEVLVGSGVIGLLIFLAILLRCLANYTIAIDNFRQRNEIVLESLTRSYRLSFITVAAYLFILSAIEHKLFLLAIAFAQIALRESEPSTQSALPAPESSALPSDLKQEASP